MILFVKLILLSFRFIFLLLEEDFSNLVLNIHIMTIIVTFWRFLTVFGILIYCHTDILLYCEWLMVNGFFGLRMHCYTAVASLLRLPRFLRKLAMTGQIRHCEERSDEAIPMCSAYSWDCTACSE